MKITESYLRKIIRGAINEMFSSSAVHATPSFHDAPPPEEAPTETVDQLVTKLTALASADGISPPDLMSKLLKAIEAEEKAKTAKTAPSGATPFGLNENKKRK